MAPPISRARTADADLISRLHALSLSRPWTALSWIQSSYDVIIEEMSIKITYTRRAKRVERWIRAVKRDLDAAEIKVVGLDCEFTDPRLGRANQSVAVIQLSVAQETLVFHAVHADEVPEALFDFLADEDIKFCGAGIQNDVTMLRRTYDAVRIPSAINLQQVLRNPTAKPTPSLYDLANHYIRMSLKPKKKIRMPPKIEDELTEDEALVFGWGNFPLSHNQLQYAALDARLGFELGRII